MKRTLPSRGLIVLLLSACAFAQEPSSSLGDVARKSRKEHTAVKPGTTDEDDGPDAGGVWHARTCAQQTMCYELAVTLPRNPRWSRQREEPRPVLIPLAGREGDPSHVIRVYSSDAIPRKGPYDGTRTFVQAWFARPEYFGQSARITLKQNQSLNGYNGAFSHFTVTSGTVSYRGQSVVASGAAVDLGFACVFRDDDAAAAASVCEAIVNSARAQMLFPVVRHYYPPYQPPSVYYYPRTQEPQEDDDPE